MFELIGIGLKVIFFTPFIIITIADILLTLSFSVRLIEKNKKNLFNTFLLINIVITLFILISLSFTNEYEVVMLILFLPFLLLAPINLIVIYFANIFCKNTDENNKSTKNLEDTIIDANNDLHNSIGKLSSSNNLERNINNYDKNINDSKGKVLEKPKKRCPKCGTGNGMDAEFCFICNHHFEQFILNGEIK